MKYHISIHITPYEIDDYQTFIHQLRRNLNYISDTHIVFSPCLNVSNYFYDWGNSILSKEYFINKFNSLNNIVQTDFTLVDETINFDDEILGALSYKRHFIEKYKNQVEAFIWFDSDIIFPDDTLYTLINAFEQINHPCCIITPQLPKLWDETWDIIVNKNYITENPSHHRYLNFDPYCLYTHNNNKTLIENEHYTKFGAGWGNLLSSDLFKNYITLPDSLGHYGIDDTFIMYAVDILKKRGHNIKQFIIEELIVAENNKFKLSSLYKNLITLYPNIKTKEEFRIESEQGMINELNKMYYEDIF